MAWPELNLKDDKEVVAFVESKEIVQAAWYGDHTSGNAVVLTYKKSSKTESDFKSEKSTKQKLSLKGKYKICNISLFTRNSLRVECIALTLHFANNVTLRGIHKPIQSKLLKLCLPLRWKASLLAVF